MSTTSPEYQTHEGFIASVLVIDGARGVDIGCGSGALVRWLRAKGADVVGIECGEVMLAMAREADPDHLGSYIEGVGQDLPLASESFDFAVFSYSLHHVPEPDMVTALGEAHRVLRPGGTLYVVEPVAAGPGHEVIKLIDDETEVRAWAQGALDRAAEVGFETSMDDRYVSRMILEGADQLAERVVGVDPRRAEKMAALRPQFVERFLALATPVGEKYALEQENIVRIFHKP